MQLTLNRLEDMLCTLCTPIIFYFLEPISSRSYSDYPNYRTRCHTNNDLHTWLEKKESHPPPSKTLNTWEGDVSEFRNIGWDGTWAGQKYRS